MRSLYMTWAAAMAALAITTSASAQDGVRYVRGTLVNLRAAADRTSAVLARLRLDTPVQLQGPDSGEFCAVTPLRGHPAPGFIACALLAPRELGAAALAAELKPWREAYEILLAQRGSTTPLPPAARRLLLDPREALALLEKQFYLRPSIETLAWYGGLAEDLAYLGGQTELDGPGSPALVSRPDWLPAARAGWRTMISLLEQGWAPDDRWPAAGPLRYMAAASTEPEDAPYRHWLVPVKPSLWREDGALYATSGEPLTRRRLLRGAAGAAGAVYAAEISAAWDMQALVQSPNQAGGFRAAGPLLEFLKGQANAPRLKFVHRASYAIDGMLGTVGAELTTPDAGVWIWALGREGLAAATQLQLSSQHQHCGPNEGIRVTLPAPRPRDPLAYLVTLRPLEPARVKVSALGSLQRAADASSGDGGMRYQGWRFDLDGDGQPDLLVLQGRGKAVLPTSGLYANSTQGDDSLLNIVWANIDGVWKRVAYAAEDGCT